MAPSTRLAYSRTLREFARLRGSLDYWLIASPFTEQEVLRYIAFLFNGGFSPSSIISKLSAITFWIRVKGWPLVTQGHLVKQALRGARSLSASSSSAKFPITPDILKQLCNVLPNLGVSKFDACRLRAMFLLAFHGFLRAGEICGSRHALQLDDIRSTYSFIQITFRSFKFSKGRSHCVFIPASNTAYCPVHALRNYLQLRGPVKGALFLEEDGSPGSLSAFRKILVVAASAAGLNSKGLTPHSFRVGAATAAAAIGIPDDSIQRMGRWSSWAFTRYIKYHINRF